MNDRALPISVSVAKDFGVNIAVLPLARLPHYKIATTPGSPSAVIQLTMLGRALRVQYFRLVLMSKLRGGSFVLQTGAIEIQSGRFSALCRATREDVTSKQRFSN